MKKLLCSFIVCVLWLISGCQKEDWCTVIISNESNNNIYDSKIIGWPGVLCIGGNFGGILPVPDEITITWKTIKPGKEEIYKKHKESVERIVQENLSATENSEDVTIPNIPEMPEGIFDSHKVVLVLKGKVPKRPENGKVYITYKGNEQFDVKYVEDVVNNK